MRVPLTWINRPRRGGRSLLVALRCEWTCKPNQSCGAREQLPEIAVTTLTTTSNLFATKTSAPSWGWLVAFGVALIAFGGIAFFNLPVATAASVLAIGVLMLIGASLQLVASFFARSWSGFGLALVSAVLYGVAGALTIANPLLAAEVLTLMLAFSLIFSGATRIWWSAMLRPLPGWGWITASGIVSILAGIVFIAGWPANTVYLLGMVLAFDLTFQGITAVALGFTLKSVAA